MIKDNKIIYQTGLHWVVFIPSAFVFVLGLAIIIVYPPLLLVGLLLFTVGGLGFLAQIINYKYSYLNLYADRLRIQTGLLSRQSIDMPYTKMESVDIRQPVMGCLLNYGSLYITGSGGSIYYIHKVREPLTCRRYLEQCMVSH